MITVSVIPQYKMCYLVSELKKEKTGNYSYVGFHYFNPQNINYYGIFEPDEQEKPLYFIAKIDNKVVGILKLGHYVEERYQFHAVNFVDVHKNYKQKGVATELYKALDKWGKERKTVIIGTRMSEEGKKANIHCLRKRILENTSTFDTIGEYLQSIKNQNSKEREAI